MSSTQCRVVGSEPNPDAAPPVVDQESRDNLLHVDCSPYQDKYLTVSVQFPEERWMFTRESQDQTIVHYLAPIPRQSPLLAKRMCVYVCVNV